MSDSIPALILDKEFLAAWFLLFMLFVGACLFKQPYIHTRVIKHSIASMVIVLIPIILTEIFGGHTGVVAAAFAFPFVLLTAISSVISLPHEALILYWLRKKQKNGRQAFSITLVKKYYRCFFSDRGRFAFLRQIIKHGKKTGNELLIDECYEKIDKLRLFVRESNGIAFNQQMFYFQLGAVNRAEELLNKSDVSFRESPDALLVKSHIARAQMKFDDERMLLEKIISSHNADEQIKLMALNSYAVNAIARNNKEEIISAAFRAYKMAKNKSIHKHTVVPNLIDHFLLFDIEKAEVLFSEYRDMIDFNSLEDVLAWNNYCLTYYRQKNDRANLKKTIDYLEYKIIPITTEAEKFSVWASTLRIRWDDDMDWKKCLEYIDSMLDTWLAQPAIISFWPAKHLFSVVNGTLRSTKDEYERVYQKLLSYFRKILPSLEAWRNDLPSTFVNLYCHLSKEKAWLILFCFDFENADENDLVKMIDTRTKLYFDIIDIYESNHSLINMLHTRLILIEEIIRLFEIPQIRNLLDQKKIQSHTMRWLKVVQDQTLIAYESVNHARNDRTVLYDKIALAYFFVFLRDVKKAQLLFEDFLESGVSPNNLSRDYRCYYESLTQMFS